MKTTFGALILFVLFCSVECDPRVTFTEPQPAGIKDLKKIPEKITGTYLTDGGIMTITETLIEVNKELLVPFKIADLDENEILIGDSVVVEKESGNRIPVKRISGDSLHAYLNDVDTIIDLTQGDLIKKWKGRYFLNHNLGPDRWEVIEFHREKQIYYLNRVADDADTESITYMKATNDTVKNPTYVADKKKFKKFVNRIGFTNESAFTKK